MLLIVVLRTAVPIVALEALVALTLLWPLLVGAIALLPHAERLHVSRLSSLLGLEAREQGRQGRHGLALTEELTGLREVRSAGTLPERSVELALELGPSALLQPSADLGCARHLAPLQLDSRLEHDA